MAGAATEKFKARKSGLDLKLKIVIIFDFQGLSALEHFANLLKSNDRAVLKKIIF